ncbi:MAG: helix-turn-helix transcriptional regulator [Kofleriaceae bacterium]
MIGAERPPRRADYHATAAYIGIPVGTLRAWVSRRQIPHIRLAARIVLFDLDVIDQWLADRTVGVGEVRS